MGNRGPVFGPSVFHENLRQNQSPEMGTISPSTDSGTLGWSRSCGLAVSFGIADRDGGDPFFWEKSRTRCHIPSLSVEGVESEIALI